MRRQSREIALQILFQTEFAPQISISDLAALFNQSFDDASVRYALELVRGVSGNKEKIDSHLQEASRHWKVDRMAAVDRNIMRIAIYEIFFAQELLEPKIALNEAIELAKVFGSQESGSFVNGILDQIIRNERQR